MVLTTEIINYMLQYIEDTNDWSYYKFEKHILENKPEWADIFNDKNSRMLISEYLKSRKRAAKARYNEPTHVAMEMVVDARAEFNAKKAEEQKKELEEQQNEMYQNMIRMIEEKSH